MKLLENSKNPSGKPSSEALKYSSGFDHENAHRNPPVVLIIIPEAF
jgi:hypothetical protein